MKQLHLPIVFSLLALIVSTEAVKGNNPDYTQRQQNYIDSSLVHFNGYSIVLQAYRGIPVDTGILNGMLSNVLTNGTVDFDLQEYVRILFFGNGIYDTVIYPKISQLPYWISYDDTLRDYWSENHMCQWMSANWLLHEKYGLPVDSTMHLRMVHYLQLKVNYGFYEVFSTVYGPYCLSGLLNLADFAQDSTIQSLATQASQRLLHDMLLLTNDQGVLFPIAGRNYYDKYESAYGQNHNNLIWLLTGMGQAPVGPSHCGVMLSTSTLPVDSVISSWTPTIDTTYYHGHSLDSSLIINSVLTGADHSAFEWSFGGYFPPEMALETYTLLTDSDLWHQVDFSPFSSLSIIEPSTVVSLSEELNVFSESSVDCGDTIVLYKHHSITLSSFHDLWKGKIGFQQFPCVANVGTTAVMTASGPVYSDWDNRNPDSDNYDLPYVGQNKNVALIMYRPEAVPTLLPYHNTDVAVFFRDGDYDQVVNDSMWLLGRQGYNYVAVRRWCIGELDSVRACPGTPGQSWVIVVGDSMLYGSFANFQSKIDQSQYTETWYYDSLNQQEVYYASITFDTLNVQYAWGVDSSTTTAIKPVPANPFSVYPNPVANELTMDLSSFSNQPVSIQIEDVLGQRVFSEAMDASDNILHVNTTNLAGGLYLVTVVTESGVYTQKVVKKE
jgi:hypothetical protein